MLKYPEIKSSWWMNIWIFLKDQCFCFFFVIFVVRSSKLKLSLGQQSEWAQDRESVLIKYRNFPLMTPRWWKSPKCVRALVTYVQGSTSRRTSWCSDVNVQAHRSRVGMQQQRPRPSALEPARGRARCRGRAHVGGRFQTSTRSFHVSGFVKLPLHTHQPLWPTRVNTNPAL